MWNIYSHKEKREEEKETDIPLKTTFEFTSILKMSFPTFQRSGKTRAESVVPAVF